MSEKKHTRLYDLAMGMSGTVTKIVAVSHLDEHLLSTRLNALGVRAGKLVSVLRRGWADGPMLVRVDRLTHIAIRRSEAKCVLVNEADDNGPTTERS